jgi:peptide/nickel transport system ATP-binding protein
VGDTPVLAIRHLAVTYKTRKREIHAVRDVSFEIQQGENLGLVGESGCGKSTVAYAIVNFLGPNGRIAGGDILFKGSQLRGRPEHELRKLRGADIAMVYQEPMSALNPTMRIEDQLAEALIAHRGLSRREARRECAAALQRVHMPDVEGVLGRYPHQLSGGQQQRVLIAMAMLNSPTLLVMDEPTTALDVTVEAAVLDLIAELKEKYRTATLYISHNLGVVARVSDKVAVMYAGEVVEYARTIDIFKNPVHPYTVGLMRCLPDVDAPRGTRQLAAIPGQVPRPDRVPEGCIFAPRCELRRDECNAGRPQIEELSEDHWVRCFRARDGALEAAAAARRSPAAEAPSGAQPEVVLEACNTKVYYPLPFRGLGGLFGLEKRRYVRAVDDVSLSVRRGRTLGIVGESGCGKSTLARAIVGLEPLREGRIEFLGVDVSRPLAKRSRESIRNLQMVFQDPNGVLNPSYCVGDQIAVSLKRFKVVPRDEVYGAVVRLLNAVKLNEDYYWRLPRQLSGGEKQRVGIARAIASNPTMVVCDEPVSALDVSVQAAVLTLLQELQQQRSTAMILISHDLSAVRFLSDDVAVMYLGRVVEKGPCEAIYRPPHHPYTAALLAAVPRADPSAPQRRIRLSGNVPSAVDPPSGCRFHTRCPFRPGEICEREEPPKRELDGGHIIYCHLSPERLWEISE